ncbi:MAG: hypothetical protein U0667_16065 [Chloroflexota bacterium]
MAEDPARPAPALARALVAHIAALPDASVHAVDAGRHWARTMSRDPAASPMDRLVTLLDEAGFEPVAPVSDGDPIGLRACPFGVSTLGGPAAACTVHRGLIEGALDALGVVTGGVSLEPFVRPGLCLARVGGVAPHGVAPHGVAPHG